MNKVILIGRLGRDPETKYTGNGLACCRFSLATDESFKDRNGQKQKRSEWHRVILWGKPAEHAQKMLKKGSLVCVDGKIQSREYEKDGEKKTVHEVIVAYFLALDPKPAPGKASGGAPKAQILDDDIPF